jgi:hypothetical protein
MEPKDLPGNGSTQDQPGGEQREGEGRRGSSIHGIEMKLILERIRRM